MAQIRYLAIRNLRLDGSTQPRVEIDQSIVHEYAEALQRKVQLPPIIVFDDGTDKWIVDGFHRWHAAKQAEVTKLPCDVRKGKLEAARWYSYSANQGHGVRRSNADIKKAVTAALNHPKGMKMSDGNLAEWVGVAVMTVSRHRKELTPTITKLESTPRVGRDGRTTNTENIGKKKEESVAPAVTDTEPEDELSSAVELEQLQDAYDTYLRPQCDAACKDVWDAFLAWVSNQRR